MVITTKEYFEKFEQMLKDNAGVNFDSSRMVVSEELDKIAQEVLACWNDALVNRTILEKTETEETSEFKFNGNIVKLSLKKNNNVTVGVYTIPGTGKAITGEIQHRHKATLAAKLLAVTDADPAFDIKMGQFSTEMKWAKINQQRQMMQDAGWNVNDTKVLTHYLSKHPGYGKVAGGDRMIELLCSIPDNTDFSTKLEDETKETKRLHLRKYMYIICVQMLQYQIDAGQMFGNHAFCGHAERELLGINVNDRDLDKQPLDILKHLLPEEKAIFYRAQQVLMVFRNATKHPAQFVYLIEALTSMFERVDNVKKSDVPAYTPSVPNVSAKNIKANNGLVNAFSNLSFDNGKVEKH